MPEPSDKPDFSKIVCAYCDRPLSAHEQCCVGGIITDRDPLDTHPHFKCSEATYIGWHTARELMRGDTE